MNVTINLAFASPKGHAKTMRIASISRGHMFVLID